MGAVDQVRLWFGAETKLFMLMPECNIPPRPLPAIAILYGIGLGWSITISIIHRVTSISLIAQLHDDTTVYGRWQCCFGFWNCLPAVSGSMDWPLPSPLFHAEFKYPCPFHAVLLISNFLSYQCCFLPLFFILYQPHLPFDVFYILQSQYCQLETQLENFLWHWFVAII